MERIILFLLTNRKNILIIVFIVLSYLFLKLWNSGYFDQEKIDNHPLIGKTIKFSRPIVYTQRKSPREGVEVIYLVPIVRAIKNEIEGLHNKDDTEELINVYIPSDTTFTIEEVYKYENFINPATLYYVLSHNGNQYTISDFGLNLYQKPLYKNAQIPVQELDSLYKVKPNATLTIKFFSANKKSRFNDRFNLFAFEQCEAKNVVKTNDNIIATVNFNQLSCLYTELWNHHLSEIYPVNYEVLN